MQANIDEVYGCLKKSKLPFGPHKGELKPLEHYAFRDDPKEAKVFWDVRKGLIPIVGGARESGAVPVLHSGVKLQIASCAPCVTCTFAHAIPVGGSLQVCKLHMTSKCYEQMNELARFGALVGIRAVLYSSAASRICRRATLFALDCCFVFFTVTCALQARPS